MHDDCVLEAVRRKNEKYDAMGKMINENTMHGHTFDLFILNYFHSFTPWQQMIHQSNEQQSSFQHRQL